MIMAREELKGFYTGVRDTTDMYGDASGYSGFNFSIG